MKPLLTSRPLIWCRKSVAMYGAIQTAGAKQLPSQAYSIVPIAAARCMSTAPTTASAFLNTPAHSTPKFLAGHSARLSTVSMKMWATFDGAKIEKGQLKIDLPAKSIVVLEVK